MTLNLLPVAALGAGAPRVRGVSASCRGAVREHVWGRTYAINARPPEGALDEAGQGRSLTPAIAGDRLIVSSTSGQAGCAVERREAWLDLPGAKVESSPVVVGKTAYFGATDGRLFAVSTANGHIRWAYNTGGRINSSPSILGNRIFITTYAGSILALNRINGNRIWISYIRRDFVQYESFYASASTDGQRCTRSPCREGRRGARVRRLTVWSHELNTTGYRPRRSRTAGSTGDFNGLIHCYRATDGRSSGRPTSAAGSSPRGGRRAARVLLQPGDEDVRPAAKRRARSWRVGMGKYQPGIATDRHYYFTLNGSSSPTRGAT